MKQKRLVDIRTVLALEVQNTKASLQSLPDEVKFINKILSLYEDLADNLNTYPRNLITILQMYWTCFRGYIISIKLLLEAHIPEALAIASKSAEACGMARKMSLHPEKILPWIKKKKETSKPLRRILGRLFPEGDKPIFLETFRIYELTTEYGRHPNFASTVFFSDFNRLNTQNMVDFNYVDIDGKVGLKRGLNYLIYAYLKFLFVFKEIFKKYIKTSWVQRLGAVEKEYTDYKQTLKKVFEANKSVA